MRIGILGPLRVEIDGSLVDIGSATQRRALLFLTLRANEVVSVDCLADGIWGDNMPSNVEHSVHTLVYRLRHRSSNSHEFSLPIKRHEPGYVLKVKVGQIDSNIFTDSVEQGRQLVSEQPELARDVLESALALWRGDVLLDVAYEPWAAAEVRRLTETRVSACETLALANITLGHGELAIAELESLTELFPLRESLWVLLWQALAQAGRHLEISASHRRACETIRDEYSIIPSAHLAEAALDLAGSGQS